MFNKLNLIILICLKNREVYQNREVYLAKYISGNGELPSIPSPVPGLDFVIDIMVTETKERIKEMWDEAVEAVLEKAKDLGIRGAKEFVTLNANANKQYGLIEISQSILDKLLKGDIRRLEQIDKLKISENRELGNKSRENPTETIKNPFVYTVLYKWQEDSTINDQVVVVETIFLNV